MRRMFGVALVALGLSLSTATPAEAQFWRWLERLSGPELQGLAAEVTFLCRGSEIQDDTPHWFVSLQCSDAKRDRPWVALGVQTYLLTGDNNLTDIEGDRVDAFGFLPMANFRISRSLFAGGGVGIRQYSSIGGRFYRPDIEAWIRWRPLVHLIDGSSPLVVADPRREWLEVGVAFVLHDDFDEGRFGPGSRSLGAELRPLITIGINLR